MTHQLYYDNEVYSDRTAFVWAVCEMHLILPSTIDLLSDSVPDAVLSYVFTHNSEEDTFLKY